MYIRKRVLKEEEEKRRRRRRKRRRKRRRWRGGRVQFRERNKRLTIAALAWVLLLQKKHMTWATLQSPSLCTQNNCELSSGEGGQAGRGVCEAELMVVEAIEKEEGE